MRPKPSESLHCTTAPLLLRRPRQVARPDAARARRPRRPLLRAHETQRALSSARIHTGRFCARARARPHTARTWPRAPRSPNPPGPARHIRPPSALARSAVAVAPPGTPGLRRTGPRPLHRPGRASWAAPSSLAAACSAAAAAAPWILAAAAGAEAAAAAASAFAAAPAAAPVRRAPVAAATPVSGPARRRPPTPAATARTPRNPAEPRPAVMPEPAARTALSPAGTRREVAAAVGRRRPARRRRQEQQQQHLEPGLPDRHEPTLSW